MKISNIIFLVSSICLADAYSPMAITTRRSAMTMKKGRGSFKREIDSSSGTDGGFSSSSGNAASSSNGLNNINWITTNQSVKELPQEEGVVGLLETKAFLLVDKGTNPKGTVSVMKYGPETFCFSVQCPSCKIPLTKAKALPPNEETQNKAPRLACDFCKATFNLKTGEQVKAQDGRGIFGGLAKAVLSAQNDQSPLPVFKLAEKNGKILFNMEK
jgi:nitrite reductase/ring-hydroxylating ferredoxin subunit